MNSFQRLEINTFQAFQILPSLPTSLISSPTSCHPGSRQLLLPLAPPRACCDNRSPKHHPSCPPGQLQQWARRGNSSCYAPPGCLGKQLLDNRHNHLAEMGRSGAAWHKQAGVHRKAAGHRKAGLRKHAEAHIRAGVHRQDGGYRHGEEAHRTHMCNAERYGERQGLAPAGLKRLKPVAEVMHAWESSDWQS